MSTGVAGLGAIFFSLLNIRAGHAATFVSAAHFPGEQASAQAGAVSEQATA
jgi:hypothetical protein